MLDEKTIDTLDRFKINYIYTYNRITRREDVGNHLQYIGKGDVFEEAVSYFKTGLKVLKSILPKQKVWLDPGFGFSKSIEQNWVLAKKVPSLFGEFSEHTFLLGASRKRFLQSMIISENKDKKRKKSELFHALLCSDWMRTLPLKRTVVRLHNPEIILSVSNYIEKTIEL